MFFKLFDYLLEGLEEVLERTGVEDLLLVSVTDSSPLVAGQQSASGWVDDDVIPVGVYESLPW